MARMRSHTRTSGDPKPRRRRGTSFYVGLVLFATGVGTLGYVGWQLYGTNMVARQAQEETVEDLRDRWSSQGEAVEEVSDPRDRPPGNETQSTNVADIGSASALMRIPRFGEDYLMPVLEGVGDEELSAGFGHFPDTAGPGERGNYALAAHRVTHGEPLRDMPRLRSGDKVIVETRSAVHTYVLDTNPNDLVVTFEDIWVIDPVPDNPEPGAVEPPSQQRGQRLITLTTCAELFHTEDRMIAFGHLLRSERK